MTYGALAMTVGAILFRSHDGARNDRHDRELFTSSPLRAGRAMRRPAAGDLDMIEDDYYRFLRAPRD
jgi:hypothetical protein